MTKMKNLKLGDQVLREIVARIVNDTEASFAPPSERELCDEFGVSKTIAREVITRLEGMGIVTVSHGRRMRIEHRDTWDHFDPLLVEVINDSAATLRVVDDLNEVRLLIEPEIAARAAIRATAEDIHRLQADVARMRELMHTPAEYLVEDIAFHSHLARASGSVLLNHIINSLREIGRVSRELTNVIPDALPVATTFHERICEAVDAHDAERARVAMREHLIWARTGLTVNSDDAIARARASQ